MESINDLNISAWLPLILPLIVLQLILMISALVVCVRSEATNGPKWVWALIIIFGNLLGSIIFFIFGRKNGG